MQKQYLKSKNELAKNELATEDCRGFQTEEDKKL